MSCLVENKRGIIDLFLWNKGLQKENFNEKQRETLLFLSQVMSKDSLEKDGFYFFSRKKFSLSQSLFVKVDQNGLHIAQRNSFSEAIKNSRMTSREKEDVLKCRIQVKEKGDSFFVTCFHCFRNDSFDHEKKELLSNTYYESGIDLELGRGGSRLVVKTNRLIGDDLVIYLYQNKNERSFFSAEEKEMLTSPFLLLPSKEANVEIAKKVDGDFASIQEKLEKNKKRCCELYRDIAKGLELMHKNNYIHGDPKPANFGYLKNNKNYRAALLDFDRSIKMTNDQMINFPHGTPEYTPSSLLEKNDNDQIEYKQVLLNNLNLQARDQYAFILSLLESLGCNIDDAMADCEALLNQIKVSRNLSSSIKSVATNVVQGWLIPSESRPISWSEMISALYVE